MQKRIRNAIAHHNGNVSEEEVKQFSKINDLTILKFGDENQIQISNVSYFSKLLKDMEIFFKELLLSIDKRYNEIKTEKEKRWKIDTRNKEIIDDGDSDTPPF